MARTTTGIYNIEARSMTLVQNPAWEEATWQIVSAAEGKACRARQLPVTKFNFFNISTLKKIGGMYIPENDPKNKDPEHKPDPEVGVQFAELQKEHQKLLDDMKKHAAENEEMKKLAAEKARQAAASMPVDEVQKLIAEEATKIANEKVAAYEEERKRAAALEKLTASRSKLGINASLF